jgi:hypothetical protein
MPQPKSRFRLQFSLLGFLVATLVVCLAISHWNTSRQLATAQAEVRRFRDALGYLSVDDRSKFHAVAIDTGAPNTWRWLLFVPKGARYQWNLACEGIPQNSPPARAGIVGVSNEPYWEKDNEVLVTAQLRQTDDGGWSLGITSKIGDSKDQMADVTLKIPAEKMEWMLSVPSTDGQVIGSNGPDVRDPAGPIILLQQRACEKQPGGSYSPSAGPMPGFMIWLSSW